MKFPPQFIMAFGLLVACVSPIAAQRGIPFETPEPPLADPSKTVKPSKPDPDENGDVVPAQYVVPGRPVVLPGNGIPTPLPGTIVNPGTVTVGPTEALPYESIPTPIVTLNIEGSNDAPTGGAVFYKLVVRNASRAKAHNVVLRVTPPKNATRVKADPPPTQDNADVESRWELKVLEPGQTRTVDVSYLPKAGAEEIKILAKVQFDFGRGMITRLSPPTLKVTKEAPTSMIVGDSVTQRIIVKNTGKVTIRDIEIKEILDKGLEYDSRILDRGKVDGRPVGKNDLRNGEGAWSLSGLAPGETRTFDYRVKAKRLGNTKSIINVTFPGAPPAPIHTEHEVDILSAVLEMKAEGPTGERGIVGQATGYRVSVTNRGNADLFNVAVRCAFPADLRVTKATQSGQAYRDSVQWVFRELKPGQTQEVNVSLLANVPGVRTVQFFAKADKGNEQRHEVKTDFGGIASLDWDVDVPGTVALGKKMTYTVTVVNKGTAAAKRVQLRLDIPNGVDFLDTSPPSAKGTGANARQIIFAPADIAAGKKMTFTIDVRARAPGEARVAFQLYSAETGNEPAEHRASTQITDTSNRSPVGPPPRVDPKVDPSRTGYRGP